MPEARAAWDELARKFTNGKMQALNYKVDVQHQSVSAVAGEFLREAFPQ